MDESRLMNKAIVNAWGRLRLRLTEFLLISVCHKPGKKSCIIGTCFWRIGQKSRPKHLLSTAFVVPCRAVFWFTESSPGKKLLGLAPGQPRELDIPVFSCW